MPSTPNEYNQRQLDAKNITATDISYMMEIVQPALKVFPDGKCGPATLEYLRAKFGPKPHPMDEYIIGSNSYFANAAVIPAHASWYGGFDFANRTPLGIVWHTSDTNPGTAVNMANRRKVPYGTDPDDLKRGKGAWHLSIETDGRLVQMIPFHVQGAHAHSSTAKRLPFGWANYTTIGIELISPDDKNFPTAQVESAKKVARALVQKYHITQDRANIFHRDIDPERRNDPGDEWATQHAPKVMEYAFA